MKRRYSANDVGRYARCPRQWWYEARHDELANLEVDDLERRMAALRHRHGARAESLPAYALLADLAARRVRLAHGREVHATHAARVARRRTGCLLPATGLLLVCVCIAVTIAKR